MTLSINGKTYEAGELVAYVEKLEKENAEVKEKLKEHESVGNVQFWENVWSWKIKAEQLTKAKEIIKDFLLMAKVEHLKDRYETVDEAEQFLNSDKPREEKEERKYYCKTCRDLMCACSGTERYEINCSGVEED